MKQNFYFTTPIFYVNAEPHLGHAYTALIADVISRFYKLSGNKVFFQTGTDEHGEKVAQAAEKAGISPQQYTDKISQMFRETWPLLSIEADNFIRTTDSDHIQTVQKILQQVYDKGDIYFSEYTGLYCKGCERFLTEKELVDGLCPDHLTKPAEVCENNYFFKMGKYQDWLIEHIKTNPDFITPERYKNEVLSFLSEPLEDLCISRPISRLTWGVPLPFDNNYVTYVWFDALINYLTGIGFPDNLKYSEKWDQVEHIIAKDILKPHAIFWPTMLKSMGIPPYKSLHVHGYWNVDETKMSKSIGNVVRPGELAKSFGKDAVRYFLLREMSFGVDSSYSSQAMITRQNSDLANDLGNLVSRSISMLKKFNDLKLPSPGSPSEIDKELADATINMIKEFSSHMELFQFNRALQSIWKVISTANKYIVRTAPWELAKSPENQERLDTVLYYLFETLRLVALALNPIIPETAEKITLALGVTGEKDLKEQGEWGLLVPQTLISSIPALFPRIEKKKENKKNIEEQKIKKKKKSGKGGSQQKDSPENKDKAENDSDQITFAQFQKLDLRVGEIKAAEKIKKSDRLLKLTVAAPDERTIVAGIAEHYKPEEIIGKQVIIVANLKPAKLMGVESHGMVLAAKDEKDLFLSAITDNIKPGSKVS
jgi:methionyl-tRNA synthetase